MGSPRVMAGVLALALAGCRHAPASPPPAAAAGSVEAVLLDAEQEEAVVGEVVHLSATLRGSGPFGKRLSWSTTGGTLKVAGDLAEFSAMLPGSFRVTATSRQDRSRSASLEIRVKARPPGAAPLPRFCGDGDPEAVGPAPADDNAATAGGGPAGPGVPSPR